MNPAWIIETLKTPEVPETQINPTTPTNPSPKPTPKTVPPLQPAKKPETPAKPVTKTRVGNKPYLTLEEYHQMWKQIKTWQNTHQGQPPNYVTIEKRKISKEQYEGMEKKFEKYKKLNKRKSPDEIGCN